MRAIRLCLRKCSSRRCRTGWSVSTAASGADRPAPVEASPARGMVCSASIGGRSVSIRMALGIALAAAASIAMAEARSMYIVSLADPPLALYAGGVVSKAGRPLPPTSPQATGAARLDDASPAARVYLAHLAERQAAVLAVGSGLAKRALEPVFRYTHTGNGFALELSADEAEALRALPGVVAVEPEWVERPLADAGPGWIGADRLWTANVPTILGTRGEGVVVGVIDTGINEGHPAFAATAADGYAHTNPAGRFFGLCQNAPARCNAKLIGIWDFTTEGARDGSDSTGHGSHVAATAVGNPVSGAVGGAPEPIPVTVSGVAPRAALISYKACQRDTTGQSPSGTCPGSATLAAIEQAVRDQVAVINYSIGGSPRDPWAEIRSGAQSSTRALLAARAAGVLPVVAAGNDGPGAGTVTSPGNAPWVIAVANATHDRVFGTVLEGVVGPTVPAGTALPGASLSGGVGPRRVVHARDYGNALCGTGATQGLNPTGASNPFPPGTFNGEIVVCDRGIYARVEKGYNVLAAGAGGYVLANVAADGESIVSDTHFLPAVHLGFTDAERLRRWLADARAQNAEVRASIRATERLNDPRFGDLLNASSGRGPVQPFGGWLKPDITAPGTNILAAAGTGSGLASLSGTSMATPHVAGAAALLRALRPDWRPDQIESALLTTGRATVRASEGDRPAHRHEAGIGRAWLPDAARARLSFPQPQAEFVAGDPIVAGPDAAARINRPSLQHPDCVSSCTFVRRVVALEAGNWRIVPRLPEGARLVANPTAFALTAGASRELSLELDVSDARLAGQWVHGEIALVDDAAGLEQRLAVAVRSSVGNLPETLQIDAPSTNAFADVVLGNLVEFRDAGFPTWPLARLDETEAQLALDPTPNDPWDEPLGRNFVRTVEIAGDPDGATAWLLLTEAASTTAPRIDLYMGLDANGDGIPQAGEQVCAQTGLGSNKRCRIEVTLPAGAPARRYWVMAQNRTAGPGGSDAVRIGIAPVLAGGPESRRDGSFLASGPGRNPAGAALPIRLSWNRPDMLPGERWYGVLEYLGVRGGQPIGRTLVELRASPMLALGPQVLVAGGPAIPLRLNPGVAHEQIVLDVPANASRVVVELGGPGAATADLHLAPAPILSFDPNIGRAPPRGLAVASATGPASPKRVELTGAALVPGRWFVTPTNRGSAVAPLALSATIETSGAPPRLRDNLFVNPERTNTGWFLNRAGDLMALAWYTYDEARQPTWYFAVGPGANAPVWRQTLLRYTRGVEADVGRPVGEVVLTRVGPDRINVGWRLHGRWGSEPLYELAQPSCETIDGITAEFTGNWYQVMDRGFGLNTFTMNGVEAYVPYLYDDRGHPRWVYALANLPNDGVLPVLQFDGQCPDCAFEPGTGIVVGTFTRRFTSPRTGTGRYDFTLVPPLAGRIVSEAPIARLTQDLACGR